MAAQDMAPNTAQDENVFKDALTSPLSTFSIDCDTASYNAATPSFTHGLKSRTSW